MKNFFIIGIVLGIFVSMSVGLALPDGTVFITHGGYNGNLGGLDGADAKCQSHANTAVLGGTWVALLSDSNTNARDRIPDTVYKKMDGTIIANSKVDLFDETIERGINLTENGVLYTISDKVWTGSTSAGLHSGASCNDWTSSTTDIKGTMGHSHYSMVNTKWISYSSEPLCTNTPGLYCMQISIVTPTTTTTSLTTTTTPVTTTTTVKSTTTTNKNLSSSTTTIPDINKTLPLIEIVVCGDGVCNILENDDGSLPCVQDCGVICGKSLESVWECDGTGEYDSAEHIAVSVCEDDICDLDMVVTNENTSSTTTTLGTTTTIETGEGTLSFIDIIIKSILGLFGL